jgi:hypothetical protein
MKTQKSPSELVSERLTCCCDPAGIRTQDPYIKSVMLYQLSYEIVLLACLKGISVIEDAKVTEGEKYAKFVFKKYHFMGNCFVHPPCFTFRAIR